MGTLAVEKTMGMKIFKEWVNGQITFKREEWKQQQKFIRNVWKIYV